jgi:hypothetical protein
MCCDRRSGSFSSGERSARTSVLGLVKGLLEVMVRTSSCRHSAVGPGYGVREILSRACRPRVEHRWNLLVAPSDEVENTSQKLWCADGPGRWQVRTLKWVRRAKWRFRSDRDMEI